MTNQEESGMLIVESDGDLPFVMSVTAYLKWNNHLVVSLERQDMEEPKYNYQKEAEIEETDVMELARKLQVKTEDLPQELYNRFKDTSYCLPPSEAERIFGDILNFLLNCGVHYQLKG